MLKTHGTPGDALHARIIFVCTLIVLEIVQQVDEIQIIQFEPIGNRRGRAPSTMSERVHNSAAQIRIEDFTNADHNWKQLSVREAKYLAAIQALLAADEKPRSPAPDEPPAPA